MLSTVLTWLTACTGTGLEPLSADATPEAFVARADADASVVPSGQYTLGGHSVTCGTAATVLSPQLNDYAASYPKFIVLRPDLMAKPPTAVKLWIYYHECGHVLGGPDESKADCFAINKGVQQGWLKGDGLDQICDFIAAAKADATHFGGADRCRAMRACYAQASHHKR